MIARMISRPVSSPSAWAIRACEWPPSRPSATWPLTWSKCVPQSISSPIRVGCFAHDHLDDLGVAQALAGRQRVGDVVVEPVFGVEHAGNAPLGVVAVAFAHLVLGHDQHAVRLGNAQRGPEAGDAAADDQHVGEMMRQFSRVEAHEITARRVEARSAWSAVG